MAQFNIFDRPPLQKKQKKLSSSTLDNIDKEILKELNREQVPFLPYDEDELFGQNIMIRINYAMLSL